MSAFCRVDENGFTCFTCPGCGCPSHPATGSQLSTNFVMCWACTLRWAKWVHRHTNSKGRRKGGPNFYDHVR